MDSLTAINQAQLANSSTSPDTFMGMICSYWLAPFFHLVLSAKAILIMGVLLGGLLAFTYRYRRSLLGTILKRVLLVIITIIMISIVVGLMIVRPDELLAAINQEGFSYQGLPLLEHDLIIMGASFAILCLVSAIFANYVINNVPLRLDGNSWWLRWLRPKAPKTVLTDAKDMGIEAGYELKYNILEYFDRDQGMFMGLNRDTREPVYLPIDEWNEQHVQIVGQSGLGKGVLACQLLAQSLMHQHAVFVIDPKGDTFTPCVLEDMAKRYQQPFHIIDIGDEQRRAQFNLFADMTDEDVLQLFEAGFGLGDSGSRGHDHYRSLERDTMNKAVDLYREQPELTVKGLYDLFKTTYPDIDDDFVRGLKETAGIDAIDTLEGIRIKEVVEKGGCVYVVGSTDRNHRKRLQKMLTFAVVLFVKKTARSNRPHVTLFLDELKHCLSENVVNNFGMVRSFDGNIICAHQSLGDFKGAVGDLDGDAVKGAVVDNTRLKFIYQTKEHSTRRWAVEHTGTTFVTSKEVSRSKSHGKFTSKGTQERIQKTSRPLIDDNTMTHLAPQWALLIGVGKAKVIKTSMIKTTLRAFPIIAAPRTTPMIPEAEAVAARSNI